MKYGPLVFLAAFFALACSWFGFVLTPQMQVGRLEQTNALVTGTAYPSARPGMARQGLEVYRANGCAYCHSQQIGQTGTVCDAVLTEAGTNQPALVAALIVVRPALSETEARGLLKDLPKPILEGATRQAADAAIKILNASGAKSALRVVPMGPDIARGWGKRRTVAEDFIFDRPVMLGSQRVGPDLANVGLRQPDPNWHLRHLYSPPLEMKGSAMPSYRFLFEMRKIGPLPSAEALSFTGELAPPPGYEVVPRPEGRALVAYLLSLRSDAPLFDAPVTPPPAPAPATTTNVPARSAAVAAAAIGVNTK